MTWCAGDHVEWESTCSRFIFRGQIEGFLDKEGTVAMCTDQTGRGSRPVRTDRLRPAAPVYWQPNKVA